MTTAWNDTANTREDDLATRVYQQVIGAQAEQYAAAYDADAGLARFTGWLQDHAAGELGADQAMAELYSLHYQPLVRLATLLVRDIETAEDVVRDSFTAMRDARRRLRDPDHALAYLRQAVVNRSRSVLRHRTIVAKDLQEAAPDNSSAEHEALLLERSEVIAALSGLPERQREAIVLRYYADLSEGQIAAAMGISRGAVNSHAARGMSALRAALEQATAQPARAENSEHRPGSLGLGLRIERARGISRKDAADLGELGLTSLLHGRSAGGSVSSAGGRESRGSPSTGTKRHVQTRVRVPEWMMWA